MCGITGFINGQHTLHDMQSIIHNMSNSLYHRGPDDSGIWLDDSIGVALGHRRLAVIDLSIHGHQPMLAHNEQYVMVYNGEIYNYLSIKQQLHKEGHQFSGHSDTEVILAAIVAYGIEHTLKLISGMFALAVWDKREQVLYLARDRIGEKPLYYGLVNGTFIFGSELKAFQHYPYFSQNISHKALSALLQYGYIPAPYSIYDNTFKLMPGTYLTVDRKKLANLPQPKTYWSIKQVVQTAVASPLCITENEAIEHTDKLLQDIVQKRMLADVPLGAFLSGGIDSSLITALMQINSKVPVKTFTIGFHEKSHNEAEYAKAVAAHLKTNHTELYISPEDALAVIPRLPDIYDEPFADSSSIPVFFISKLAKEQVTVCLTGDGGDEIFGGYVRYLNNSSLFKFLLQIPYPLRALIKNLALALPLNRLTHRINKKAEVLTIRSYADLYEQRIRYYSHVDRLIKNAKPCRITDFIEIGYQENMMLTDTLIYLPDDILVKVDRATMAVSLESRAPYLDHELIEFIWRLPMNMKIRENATKWLLKQVLLKYVPNHLIDRPKKGFSAPISVWLRGPLREWAESLLAKEKLNQQNYFKTDLILKIWHEHLAGKGSWNGLLWSVLMFQAWLEKTKN